MRSKIQAEHEMNCQKKGATKSLLTLLTRVEVSLVKYVLNKNNQFQTKFFRFFALFRIGCKFMLITFKTKSNFKFCATWLASELLCFAASSIRRHTFKKCSLLCTCCISCKDGQQDGNASKTKTLIM